MVKERASFFSPYQSDDPDLRSGHPRPPENQELIKQKIFAGQIFFAGMAAAGSNLILEDIAGILSF